jgi:N-acetylmuramoyl-L-alanine amidase
MALVACGTPEGTAEMPELPAGDAGQVPVPVAGAARVLLDAVPQEETAAPREGKAEAEPETEASVEAQEIPETAEPQEEQDTEETPCMELDDADAYLLAKIAMAEAEGEDTEGKALVIRVVLNRVASDEFPDTVREVLYQKKQFSPISNGRFDRVEPDSDCYAALEMVSSGWDGSEGALYFESESASTWHRDHLKYLFTHGNHYFYTERDGEEDG